MVTKFTRERLCFYTNCKHHDELLDDNYCCDLMHAGTVFAYGVTSSGKTHTMHVSVEQEILSFLTCHLCPVSFIYTMNMFIIGY